MLESQEAQYNAGLLGNCLHKPPLREEGKAGTGGVFCHTDRGGACENGICMSRNPVG